MERSPLRREFCCADEIAVSSAEFNDFEAFRGPFSGSGFCAEPMARLFAAALLVVPALDAAVQVVPLNDE
jgi:hypothetical protein